MSLMEKIDTLREEASRVAAESNTKTMLELPAWRNDWRCTLEGLEAKIEELLYQYDSLPVCPYPPCPGRLEPTPTKHVLRCTHCAALALPGRMTVLTYEVKP